MINSPLGSIHSQSNGLVNLDLTENWWACEIFGGHVFGPFGWTKGGPHKHELTESYPTLELRRALLLYIYIYISISIFTDTHTYIKQIYPR